MDQENIMFFENDKSYAMVDLYLNDRFLGYKDSYNYYDIDVDKILLFKKSDNEYIIRYNDVNKMMIVPLQLKINNSYNEINTLAKNNRVMFIYNDDKELFRKCREIWNKITELIGIDDPTDFVQTTLDNDEGEFIMLKIEKYTSAVKDKYRNDLAFIFHSFLIEFPQTSLVQYRY